MSAIVFRHVVRQHRLRLLVVVAALTAWGTLMPIVYSSIGEQMASIIRQFPAFEELAHFGGGDLFSLPGTISLGFIHPIAIALLAVFAIALPLSGVAGERQRGTLEIVLARPVSRRSYYLTLLVATILFIGLSMAATLVGTVIACGAVNVLDQLNLANLPLLWLNGVLLYFAIAAIAFAASVSFDRMGPAAGIVLSIVLVAYFLQIIGSLWPDADWLQAYSLFHYLQPDLVLRDGLQAFDTVLLLLVGAGAVVYALSGLPTARPRRTDVGLARDSRDEIRAPGRSPSCLPSAVSKGVLLKRRNVPLVVGRSTYEPIGRSRVVQLRPGGLQIVQSFTRRHPTSCSAEPPGRVGSRATHTVVAPGRDQDHRRCRCRQSSSLARAATPRHGERAPRQRRSAEPGDRRRRYGPRRYVGQGRRRALRRNRPSRRHARQPTTSSRPGLSRLRRPGGSSNRRRGGFAQAQGRGRC